MKIGLVGGGTGGHFYPLIAVANELQASDYQPELYYFGPAPYDKVELQRHAITYAYIPAGKLRRYFSPQNILDLFRNFFGIFIAIIRLYVIYPDVIFSKGGYTTVPVLIAACVLNIPVVIHESDAVPGRANMLAKKFAQYIAISYDDAAAYFPPEKTALTGIPMRPEITNIPTDPFSYLGIPNDRPLLYITGGSLGAARLNDAVLQSLTELLPKYRIFHQTGDNNIDDFRLTAQSLLRDSDLAQYYYLAGKIPAAQVSALLAAAAVIITRAGSTTLFEIAYHGKPSIVVPIPEDVSRDQRTNAYAFARTGGASVIEQQNLTPHLLTEEIQSIIEDSSRYASMATAAQAFYIDGAAKKLADILLSIGIEHGS